MKKITDIFKEKEKTFSFEFFPPKTEQGYQKLLETISLLTELKPDFISVTYGAGGGNRDKTIEIVDYVQKNHRISGMAHLTCVLHTKDEIKTIVDDIQRHGICNILALRGDPPKDYPNWQPGEQNYKYSYELCQFIRSRYGDYFSIGVAGFPEGHILSENKESDAKYLKLKMDSGADFVVTQLFFDNKDYFEYVQRLKRLGVHARIIPGIIPITDYNGIIKFCESCGAQVPQTIRDIFSPIKDDKEATLRAGIKFAIQQCRGLLTGGAPGIHFYTLNKLHPVNVILKEIKNEKPCTG